MSTIKSLLSAKPKIRADIGISSNSLLDSVEKEFEKLIEKRDELKALKNILGDGSNNLVTVNFGGTSVEIDRDLMNTFPNSLKFRFAILSGRYDQLLPKDKNGRIFLDLDYKWMQPHLGLLQDMAMWDGDESSKPESARILDVDLEANEALGGYFKEFETNLGLNESSETLRNVIQRADDVILSLLTDQPRSPGKELSSTLLYRCSRDGFSCPAFHKKLEGCTDLLFVIRDTEGNIFGAFVDIPWTGNVNAWKHSEKCFLFNLKRGNEIKPVKHKIQSSYYQNATCMQPYYYLNMGSRTELRIAPGCETSASCASSTLAAGGTYETHGFPSITTKAAFQVADIEVFKVEVIPRRSLLEVAAASFEKAFPAESSVIAAPSAIPRALPSVAVPLQDTLALHSDIQTHCMDLIRADFEVMQEATALRDELRFVATHCGITLPVPAVVTGKKRGRDESESSEQFQKVLTEIRDTFKLMIKVKTEDSSSGGSSRKTSSSSAAATENGSSIVTFSVSGTLISVSKAALLQAPEGSILHKLSTSTRGQEVDGEGNIKLNRAVNSRLFAVIINYLRLKALPKSASDSGEDTPIVIYREDKAALDKLLAMYDMSGVTIKCL